MITATNIQHHPDMPWEEYLKLPSKSFSSLKDFTFPEETPGMRIGTLVHRYLLKPSEYDYEEANIVMPIANALIRFLSPELIRTLVCEVPMTATFIWDEFAFDWKGIPDMKLTNVIVVDIKVLAGSLVDYIKRFNYDNQLRGYMIPNRAEHGLIVAYNKKKRRVEHEFIFQDYGWWANKIQTMGQVIKQNV